MVTAHAHRWRLSEPDGPYARGVCQTCGLVGDEQQFPNYDLLDDFAMRNSHKATNEHRKARKAQDARRRGVREEVGA